MAILFSLLCVWILYEDAKKSDESKNIVIWSLIISSVCVSPSQHFSIHSVLFLSIFIMTAIEICYGFRKK